MTKDANYLSISELIYYITVFNPKFEHIDEIEKIIERKFKFLYKFTDEEIALLRQIEEIKFKNRGKDIDNYLFSHNLTASQKIRIIYDLYENDELYKLSLSEQAIGINLMNVVEDIYFFRKSLTKNKDDKSLYEIASNNYEAVSKITDEIMENHISVILNKEDSSRFIRIYVNECLPTEKDKNEIKQMLKKKRNNQKR